MNENSRGKLNNLVSSKQFPVVRRYNASNRLPLYRLTTGKCTLMRQCLCVGKQIFKYYHLCKFVAYYHFHAQSLKLQIQLLWLEELQVHQFQRISFRLKYMPRTTSVLLTFNYIIIILFIIIISIIDPQRERS